MPGLPSDLTAFLFKLLHCLLPTKDRIARMGGGDGLCGLCGELETPRHVYFECRNGMICGLALLGQAQQLVPALTPEAALRLQLGPNLVEEQELALVTLLACGLKYIWETRLEGKRVQVYKMRAEAEARVSILRKTRYSVTGDIITDMIM